MDLDLDEMSFNGRKDFVRVGAPLTFAGRNFVDFCSVITPHDRRHTQYGDDFLNNSFDITDMLAHNQMAERRHADESVVSSDVRYFTISRSSAFPMPTAQSNQSHHQTSSVRSSRGPFAPAANGNNYVRFKPFTCKEKQAWTKGHPARGFIRVYEPNSSLSSSVVVPLSLSTTSRQICARFGLQSQNALHVQFNGETVRRLSGFDHPLEIQNEYLTNIGYQDDVRKQEVGDAVDLGFLIRFYAGRPFSDDGFGHQTLSAYCYVRKSKVFHHWNRRLCVLNGARLLLYQDLFRTGEPDVIALHRSKVEEVQLKTRGRCIKVTASVPRRPVQTVYLAFDSVVDLNAWLARCVKAAAKVPPISDLSNLQLECLPEQVFCVGSDRLLTQLNLRRNCLRPRPTDEDMSVMGWLDDLPRLQSLRSLNLADNDLGAFPACVLLISSLTELNLASNKLGEIPPEISRLKNIQTLNLQNNQLNGLPPELATCQALVNLDLSFNCFTVFPEVLTRLTVECWTLSGNFIEDFASDELLRCMGHVRKLELRRNKLRLGEDINVRIGTLQLLTHLDLRDNTDITSLDLRCLAALQVIQCQRSALTCLQLNGACLTCILIPNNEVSSLIVMPVPQHLRLFNVSSNKLTKLPEWLTELSKLENLIAFRNKLTTVPHRLFTSVCSLKHLDLSHNQIRALPTQVENCFLEHIDLHHNKLTQLPAEFLSSLPKLRYLNLAQNSLVRLPELNTFPDLNKVQQLILAGNKFQDDVLSVVAGYRRMRVLDLAYNQLRNLDGACVEKLRVLEEINVSGNRLHCLPPTLADLPNLVVLRAHSNQIVSLPDFSKSTSLKVLDVGSNRLETVDLQFSAAPQLKHLDLSCNPKLNLDASAFQEYKEERLVALIDMSQEGSVPQLTSTEAPFQAGFSETSGERNKLCITQIRQLNFGEHTGDALFGMIDGGLNNEIPLHLQSRLPQIVQDELAAETSQSDYLRYSFLAAHRSLEASGQKMGASCTLCHIVRCTSERSNEPTYVLRVANVGNTEAVLCRNGKAIKLTTNFMVATSPDEYERVRQSGGIVTEDSEVNGITPSSRLLGCSFLYPSVVPDPFLFETELSEPDEFLLLASRGLWEKMDEAEAVKRVRFIPNPILAAKHLQDIAQAYGYVENLSVLVVRFFFNPNFPDGAPPPPLPIASMHANLRPGKLAASALNLAESSDTLHTMDEVQSEPRGRRQEKPNYYFEYKRQLKELMLESQTTIYSAAASVETVVDARAARNVSDEEEEDDDSVSVATLTPPATCDTNFEDNCAVPYTPSISQIPAMEGFRREPARKSGGSSSSSGLGRSDHSGSHNGSLDKPQHLEVVEMLDADEAKALQSVLLEEQTYITAQKVSIKTDVNMRKKRALPLMHQRPQSFVALMVDKIEQQNTVTHQPSRMQKPSTFTAMKQQLIGKFSEKFNKERKTQAKHQSTLPRRDNANVLSGVDLENAARYKILDSHAPDGRQHASHNRRHSCPVCIDADGTPTVTTIVADAGRPFSPPHIYDSPNYYPIYDTISAGSSLSKRSTYKGTVLRGESFADASISAPGSRGASPARKEFTLSELLHGRADSHIHL